MRNDSFVLVVGVNIPSIPYPLVSIHLHAHLLGYGESFPGQSGFKDKIIPILHAMRVFRMPLILVNIITITYLLILY